MIIEKINRSDLSPSGEGHWLVEFLNRFYECVLWHAYCTMFFTSDYFRQQARLFAAFLLISPSG
jgi:hypothetical protein